MDKKMSKQLYEDLKDRSTEDLQKILIENDRERYCGETFEAARQLLSERGEAIPLQKSGAEAEQTPEVKTEEPSKKVIEVRLENGEIKEFEDLDKLREEIINGNLKKDYNARISFKPAKESEKDKDKEAKEIEWSTLEKIARTEPKLDSLYRPVWSYTMKFMGYGIIAGIILKALDTTWFFFEIDPSGRIGFTWLLIVGSLIASKWWKWAPVAVIFLTIKSGIRINLFVTVFAVALVGAIFGAPAGMVVGTIAGHFKKGSLPSAQHISSEGAKPYLIGLLAPLTFLVIAIPLYLFWFTPMVFDWLSKGPR